jgi:hypothetical protein
MQNDAISSSTKPQRNLATARLQHVGRTTRRVRKMLAMNEIRRLAARGYSHGEIMDAVGLPERTYYRYLVEVFRHDRELLEEQDVEIFATELSIFKERILNSYRRLVMIATREKSSDRDKIEAEKVVCELALALLKLQIEGPVVLQSMQEC